MWNKINMSKTKLPTQHIDKDGFVLLVKCLNRDGTSYQGFVWPKAGTVTPKVWSREATCDSGGLFGWPWGFPISHGKNVDACAPWLVFRAKPENVIYLDGKAKAVPSKDGKDLPEVVYYGDQSGAMKFTMEGRMAFVTECSRGSASQTGDMGSAEVHGIESCAVVLGIKGKARALKGCWLTIAEWEKDKQEVWHRVDVKTVKVDGKKIKADTWYQLCNGKFVEVARA
jgi:hypothetical protein